MKFHTVPTKALQELCGALDQQAESRSEQLPAAGSVYPYYLDTYLKLSREQAMAELSKAIQVEITEQTDVEVLEASAQKLIADVINSDLADELSHEEMGI